VSDQDDFRQLFSFNHIGHVGCHIFNRALAHKTVLR
jgi:hypothetical protein